MEIRQTVYPEIFGTAPPGGCDEGGFAIDIHPLCWDKPTSLRMTERRTRNKNFTPIGSVIDQVLRKHRPDASPALLAVWEIWDAAVGSAVAANARPAAFKGDLLLVHVSNSTWLHQLRFMETALIERLNQALDGQPVKRVRFKIGPV